VRGVITLGTPFSGAPESTNAWRLFRLTSGRDIKSETGRFDLPTAPPVPTTSIFSRSDGIVAWQGSLQAPCKGQPEYREHRGDCQPSGHRHESQRDVGRGRPAGAA
jgi:hypothetical protein